MILTSKMSVTNAQFSDNNTSAINIMICNTRITQLSNRDNKIDTKCLFTFQMSIPYESLFQRRYFIARNIEQLNCWELTRGNEHNVEQMTITIYSICEAKEITALVTNPNVRTKHRKLSGMNGLAGPDILAPISISYILIRPASIRLLTAHRQALAHGRLLFSIITKQIYTCIFATTVHPPCRPVHCTTQTAHNGIHVDLLLRTSQCTNVLITWSLKTYLPWTRQRPKYRSQVTSHKGQQHKKQKQKVNNTTVSHSQQFAFFVMTWIY